MPIWRTEPIDDEPEMRLSPCRILELPNGDRHFCGYDARRRAACVSQRISAFDPRRRRGATKAGRVYELAEPGQLNHAAEAALGEWLSLRGVARRSVRFVDPAPAEA